LSGYASEPDGITSASPQADWLRIKLAASNAKWKVVLIHQPPYSSMAGYNGTVYQWPFKLWGADLLLTGHIHACERFLEAGLPIITCGLGGEEPLVTLGAPIAGSLFQYDDTHGAVRMVAGCARLVCEFYAVGGTTPLDTLTLTKP
jgi:tartrate-resistant acid phosphatase type 5